MTADCAHTRTTYTRIRGVTQTHVPAQHTRTICTRIRDVTQTHVPAQPRTDISKDLDLNYKIQT